MYIMRKWILFGMIVFFSIILWLSISIYQTAFSPVKEDEKKASTLALQLSDIDVVTNVDIYRGTEYYMIVQGFTAEEEEIIVWILDDEIVETKKASEGIQRNEVLNYVQTDRNPKEIVSITLAMERNIPLWEIKFKDANDRYNLYYVTYENGEFFQRITF